MPSKKKKYNARFPAGRIKKIMQTDEEVGKVAQAVPVIISRTLELFVESLIKKSMQITLKKNARTLSPHHMKLCILSENRFDFLRELVKGVPEVSTSDDDISSVFDSQSSSVPSTIERRNSISAPYMEVNELPPSEQHVTRPSFYKERDEISSDQPSNSHAFSTSSGSTRVLEGGKGELSSSVLVPSGMCSKVTNNEDIPMSDDEDSDSQSSDGNALVVSTPDQNCSGSCDPSDEDCNT